MMACSGIGARRLLVAAALLACAAAASARLYECPDRPGFAGCKACEHASTRRADTLVCNTCEEGYRLSSRGSRHAECECAPGFAARGNDGVCKKCPEGTQIALGGPTARARCLSCPKGTHVNADGSDCLCPAGTYRAVADQPTGLKHVACRPCEARNAYMATDMHDRESCDTCRNSKIANKDHTACVDATDPDAAPLDGLRAAVTTPLNTTLTSVRATMQDARQRAEEARVARMDRLSSGSGIINPLRNLADGVNRVRDAAKKVPQLMKPGGAAAAAKPKVTLDSVVKAAAGGLGRALPQNDIVGAMRGKVDADALADAGLAPAKNVAALIGNLMGEGLKEAQDSLDWTGRLE